MTSGRYPLMYTDELAQAVCGLLAQGKSLKAVSEMEGMPSLPTVYKWIHEDARFAELYARAKMEAADALADEIQDIADNPEEDVQRSKLRVDARKWIAAKLKPKKYGEVQQHTHSADGELLEAIRSIGRRESR